jgi:hypothetical protein
MIRSIDQLLEGDCEDDVENLSVGVASRRDAFGLSTKTDRSATPLR